MALYTKLYNKFRHNGRVCGRDEPLKPMLSAYFMKAPGLVAMVVEFRKGIHKYGGDWLASVLGKPLRQMAILCCGRLRLRANIMSIVIMPGFRCARFCEQSEVLVPLCTILNMKKDTEK